MTRDGDTEAQILRLNPGLHWKKVEAYLKHLGAEVYEGSGSTVTLSSKGGSSPLIGLTRAESAGSGWLSASAATWNPSGTCKVERR